MKMIKTFKNAIGLLSMLVLSVSITSCESEQSASETLRDELNTKSLSAGPFVYKMNIQGKCPTKGNGCSKTKRANIAPDAIGALDYAVHNGADGIQNFFLNGPWREIFPNLDILQSEIYEEMISGQISGALEIVGQNTAIYCFGEGNVTFANAKYHFIVE